MDRSLGAHRVHLVHRIGAAVLGVVLCVFAVVGFARGVPFFSTRGEVVLGLSTNGVLAAISVLAGLILLGAAFVGGHVSSTITMIMGGLFLASGLVHLAIVNTQWNVFAFRLPNVFFSIVVGMVLALLGAYGRISGGLPPDNPYRREHPLRRNRPSPEEQIDAEQEHSEHDAQQEQGMLEAELAVVEGDPTPEQEEMVRRDQARRRSAERARAYRKHRGSTGR